MTTGSRFQQQAGRLTLPAAALLILIPALAAVPQQAPLGTIDEDCTAFTFGRDGRMAFAVHHVFNQHKFMIQRDDFWVGEPGRGKHKILNGDKLSRGEGGFSYTVRELRWSPGGTKLTAELLTSSESERHGNAEAGLMAFLLDANGLEIKIADGDSMISESENAAWLDDESTVVYLAQETRPRSQFSIQSVRPAAGHPERLFPDTLFFGVAWEEHGREAVAVVADSQPRGKPRLVRLDLAKQTMKELAVLDGFTGGLKLSPSEKKVSYFRDPETLEVRTLASPQSAQRVRTLSGVYFWTQDEQHLLVKSGPERRSGIIESFRVSDGASEEMFHGLTFWNFGVSPDGRRVGVSPPGKHVVNVYALEGLR
jgi:hypothetical protein